MGGKRGGGRGGLTGHTQVDRKIVDSIYVGHSYALYDRSIYRVIRPAAVD